MDVILRRLAINDAKPLAQLANNRKIWDNLRDYIRYPYKLEDAINFIQFIGKEKPEQTFAICSKSGDVCGVIGLALQKDVYRDTAELGYWIGEPFWGKGIATKAVALITNYSFEQLDLRRIYAGVFDFNRASMRVLEKNGYAKEGVFKNAIIKNHQIYDEHRYAKLKKT